MSALLSMVVSLAPRGSGRFEGGDAVQGWILDQVRRDDPGLAAALHANQELKPYTVSPLRVRLAIMESSRVNGTNGSRIASRHLALPK